MLLILLLILIVCFPLLVKLKRHLLPKEIKGTAGSKTRAVFQILFYYLLSLNLTILASYVQEMLYSLPVELLALVIWYGERLEAQTRSTSVRAQTNLHSSLLSTLQMAHKFRQEGCDIVVWDLNQEGLDKLGTS